MQPDGAPDGFQKREKIGPMRTLPGRLGRCSLREVETDASRYGIVGFPFNNRWDQIRPCVP
jgi:hypothetical protein